MAIGDPKTDTLADKRRRQRRQIKDKVSKNKKSYSPGFIEMAVTFLNKTPKEAGLFDASPRSAKGRAKAKETSRTTTVSDKQKASSQVRKEEYGDDFKGKDAPSKSSGKTWRDFKSVNAARKAGLNYFTGKDGKKKIAITAEQLKKKGMTLREYANSIKGKK